MSRTTTLASCPVGLFLFNGTLCLKTEYGSNEGRIDAYIVESGEFFWGGTSRPAEQRVLQVCPVSSHAGTSAEQMRAVVSDALEILPLTADALAAAQGERDDVLDDLVERLRQAQEDSQ